jgi:RimJ/RimL family protein N-acetyltransferase
MEIRQLVGADAERFSQLVLEVENSTDFMLYNPGERKINNENQRKMIQAFEEEDNSAIFVCEIEGQMVGYLMARGGTAAKNKHSAYLVVGISEQYRGKGIGTEMFKVLHNWALEQKLHRLELTTIANNQPAMALYMKMGFDVEGIKKHSLKIHNQYVDEVYMGKLL